VLISGSKPSKVTVLAGNSQSISYFSKPEMDFYSGILFSRGKDRLDVIIPQ
jgi:hypothetical protein